MTFMEIQIIVSLYILILESAFFPMNDFCVKSINGFCYLHLKLIYINGNNIINIYKAKFT